MEDKKRLKNKIKDLNNDRKNFSLTITNLKNKVTTLDENLEQCKMENREVKNVNKNLTSTVQILEEEVAITTITSKIIEDAFLRLVVI